MVKVSHYEYRSMKRGKERRTGGRKGCEFHGDTGCTHPVITGINRGDKFVISKTLSFGNIIVLVTLAVGMVTSWTKIDQGLINLEKSVASNSTAITNNRLAHRDILREVKESNRLIGARVDRLLELELQSRRK